MRRYLVGTALAVAMFLVGAVAVSTAASAGPSPTPKATGGVGLTSPLQYIEFNAFDYGAPAVDKGTVTYTNFDFHEDGSNVWDVRGTYPLVFSDGSTSYPHTMTVSSITPTSATSSTFTGTGVYDADNSYTWTVTGTVTGTNIVFDILYTGTNAGYTVHGIGTIGSTGSISGTAVDSNALSLTFSSPDGSVHQAFGYTANVVCAKVTGTTASFAYVIPNTSASLQGTQVLWTVQDGGSPALGHDTLGFTTGTLNCDANSVSPNTTVASGNLVVH